MPAQLLDLIAKASQNAHVLANLGENRDLQPVMCIGVEHFGELVTRWGESGEIAGAISTA
ncbi:MAG: hypothetical protein OXG40_14955 [Acidimicrobiaceae bacterium]|nr:hypothetical protein [Acidimicrobiaceae bacterium]MDE0516026.1 hypothetical protein [Acidimicrobiaceae bacterium]